MTESIKKALLNDFKIVTNEYLILFVMMMIGSFFVPFSFLWHPILSIAYLLAMLVLLFQGFNKLIYSNLFDEVSKYFSGYAVNVVAVLCSKYIVAATGLLEVLLLPVGAVLLTVSMDALEFSELLELYAAFCKDAEQVNILLIAEVIHIIVSCMLAGSLTVLAAAFLEPLLKACKSQAAGEAVQVVVYLISTAICVALYIWWIPLGMKNSLALCLLSCLVKVIALVLMIAISKRKIQAIYELM